MLEKNSVILLTEEDLKEYNSGSVSERVKDLWNLTYLELVEIINNNSYKTIT